MDEEKVTELKKKRQPSGTVPYTVSENESLASIAAQVNSTVSELKVINRLMSTAIFPGQILYVYGNSCTNTEDRLRPAIRKISGISDPGSSSLSSSSEHVTASDSQLSSDLPDDTKVREQFLKISGAKYITDGQGIIGGTLLVTCNTVMFDPSVSDPLVLEHGPDDYHVAAALESIMQITIYEDIAAKCFSWGSGLPPPKVYRGPSASCRENVKDGINSDTSTDSMNTHDINPNGDAIASNNVALDLHTDRDCAKTMPSVSAGQRCSSLAEGVDADSLSLNEVDVTIHDHSGEGSLDPVLQNHRDNADYLSKDETCDRVVESELNKSADQPSGDASADITVCERCKECDDDSAALENIISAPVNIPASSLGGVTNDGDCVHFPRRLSYISEDSKATTPLTSDEVGSSSSVHFPSFYSAHRWSIMSNPRFTPSGSFIIPADEDIYVDLSSGLFSTDPGHVGRVQDVSTLPSPPQQSFTIGDNDQTDLVYFSANESTVSALTLSSQSFRSRETSVDSDRHNSDSEVSKSSPDMKVEMIDATSREVLDEIFKRTSAYELVARPAVHFEDLPRYLCVRIGELEKGHQRIWSPMDSYKRRRLKPEYWFSIPLDRVAALHQFIVQRLPAGIYGSDDDIDPANRGFKIMSRDDLRALIDVGYAKDTWRQSKKWTLADAELENLPLPNLSQPSSILSPAHLRELRQHLPPIAEGCGWHLSYGSETHGYSLNTLYRNVQHVTSPVVLVIKSAALEVFGAMLSSTLQVSQSFYGTGESYLFTFFPFFKKFRWSGENSFFIKCNEDSICVGCGLGKFGLWLDDDLWHGRTQTCPTFKNDLLASQEDFMIRYIEVWSFEI